MEIHHRAFGFKAKITRRRSYRRTRRGRLRYRKPRFNNQKRTKGILPPPVESLRINTIQMVRILRNIRPMKFLIDPGTKTATMSEPKTKAENRHGN